MGDRLRRNSMSTASAKALEAKMQLPGFSFGIKMILILCIPLLGFLCRNFTTPDLPLAFSVLWAPAGFSLAFILLFGFSVWPAIFTGNFIYNLWSLAIKGYPLGSLLFDSSVISLGSLSQALLAGWIIRKMTSQMYFYSVRDISIFLLPAGVFSCMIASSIATFAIYFGQFTTFEAMLRTWTTFWLGDTLGVYIFTPLIVVLSLQRFPYHLLNDFVETIPMALSIFIVCYISFVKSYPLPQLLIPLCLWVTYRFRMHGAVITTFIIAFAALIPSTMGKGVFATFLSQDPLLYLVTFIVIIIGTNLFVAALVNERTEAWKKLEAYTGGLQEHLANKTMELWEAQEEIYFKEKIASIGMMMSGIGRELKKPLERVKSLLNAVISGMSYFDKVYSDQKGKLKPEIATSLENNFETMRLSIDLIKKENEKVYKIVNMIVKESDLSDVRASKVKSINLHIFLNRCLSQALSDCKLKFPNLDVIVVKEYDKRVEMIEGVAEDLTHAFINLLENSFYSLAMKNDKPPANYAPKLIIKTVNKTNSVLISIWDNGGGLTETKKANFFEPFITEDGEFSGSGLSLTMTHDIIVQEHHGELSVESDGIISQQINIELPKNVHLKKRE